MASSADIENALVIAVSDILYPPSGAQFPSAVIVSRGCPTEADIRAAVGAKNHLIGIYAVPGMSRDSTKLLRSWQTTSNGAGAMEVGRIEQIFRLDIWASDLETRDALLGVLLPALRFQTRYNLPDGTVATLMRLQSGGPNDWPSRAKEWEQSIDLMFQYPVIYTQAQPAVTQVTVTETINDGLTITTQTPA